jgi:hypothetical protein
MRLFTGLLTALLCDASAALSAPVAPALEPALAEKLRCNFVDKQGYYKFSPRKPAGKRPWSFELQVDQRARQVVVQSGAVTSTRPFYMAGGDMRFDVMIEGQKERASVNTKSLTFELLSETSRHRLRHLGACQRISA